MSHEQLTYPGPAEITVTEMKVKVGSLLSQGKVALLYKEAGDDTVKKLKCVSMGRVVKLLVKSGSSVTPGQPVLEFSGGCSHPTIMKVNFIFPTTLPEVTLPSSYLPELSE